MATLLSKKQVTGNHQMEILKKYGSNCVVTDYAIMLGTVASEYFKTKQGETLTGNWWLNPEVNGQMQFMASHGGIIESDINPRWNGVRPALTYSLIEPFVSKEITNIYEVIQIEYGEYPQTIIPQKDAIQISQVYQIRMLRPTGNAYTSDSASVIGGDPVELVKHIEYEYQGMKCIRMMGNENNEGKRLSDGRFIKKGEVYWIRVEPITWLVDKKEDIALSEKILLGGLPLYLKTDHSCQNTVVKKFLNHHFFREINFNQVENIRRAISHVAVASNHIQLLKSIMREIQSLSDTESTIKPTQFVKKER